MSKVVSFKTPAAGQKELGGRHKVWVQLKKGGAWYTPKAVSGADRKLNTHAHLRILQERYPTMRVMNKNA